VERGVKRSRQWKGFLGQQHSRDRLLDEMFRDALGASALSLAESVDEYCLRTVAGRVQPAARLGRLPACGGRAPPADEHLCAGQRSYRGRGSRR
jgi:hypothetical protein